MKKEDIKNLFERFENAVSQEGTEHWSARQLQQLLGYSKWENFIRVVDKAKTACIRTGEEPAHHFVHLGKKAEIDKGATSTIDDIVLTRYACYLLAQNGDSRKAEIAFAQTYFAVQTRRAEIVEQRLLQYQRVQARDKLSQTEKQLSTALYERGVDDKGFAMIRSKGDQALFSLNTQDLKKKMGVPEHRPLADFLPTISIKAKDLAAEMTSLNVQLKDLNGYEPVENEHIDNSTAVRKMLVDRVIMPEELPVADDVKKVQRMLKGENKNLLKEAKYQNRISHISCRAPL